MPPATSSSKSGPVRLYGTPTAFCDPIYGKLTDDNPAGTPTWGPFTRIDSAEITARAVGQMECRLTTDDRAFNLWLTELRVKAEEVA